MSTSTFTLRAKRTEEADATHLVAFKPGPLTIREFKELEVRPETVMIELSDETGDWANSRSYEVAEVTISEDDDAMVVVLSA